MISISWKEIKGYQKPFQIIQQIGREATHISGSLIDHVYIQNGFFESVNATSQTVGVHFSDHDVVRFCINHKLCK